MPSDTQTAIPVASVASVASTTPTVEAVPVISGETTTDLFNIDGETSALTAVAVVVTSLAPFFVVVFFVMDSLYKNSLAGFVCLVGLLIFLFVFRFLIVYTKMFTSSASNATLPKKWCKNYDVFGDGADGGMHFPSNIFTLTYALVYILTMSLIPVANMNDVRAVLYRSIPFIVVCTVLILANCMFVKHHCATTATALFAVVFVAILSGVTWAYVVASANYRDLGYFHEQDVVPDSGVDQPLCTICDILKTKYGKST